MVNQFLKRPIRREAAGQTIHSQAPHDTKIRMTSTIKIPSMNAAMLRGRREAARGWHSLIRRRERKELRPWSFISALWAGDDGVVVIVHRHRYVRLPTLRTTASDGYDHIFGHITLQARKPSRDHLTTSARGLGFMGSDQGGGKRRGPLFAMRNVPIARDCFVVNHPEEKRDSCVGVAISSRQPRTLVTRA